MIRFAALLAALPRDKSAWDRYAAEAPAADVACAAALLAGQRPRRLASLDTLTAWAAEVAGVPDWLRAECMAATGDRAETAALLLGPGTGAAPGLAEVVAQLERTTPLTARATLLALWPRLPPEANAVLNRLASGTFRATMPKAPVIHPHAPQTLRAVLILVQPSGPEVTLALWAGDVPVPIARLPLTLPETPEVMAWVRAHTVAKFGPVRQVEPVLVFEVEHHGVAVNPRRKAGVELKNPRILRWLRDAGPEAAEQMAALRANNDLSFPTPNLA